MKESVLTTIDLTKKYKEQTALDRVNMVVEKGDIYGFIGQNGAGKSTLLRMVTALARPTSGTVSLFGESNEAGLIEARKRVGAIIESPALHPDMSAHDNLEVHRLLRGIPGKACIAKTLALVGLQDTGKKKVKNFSLGMKQRLGLAIALLGDPELLILDEPTNGLDPGGIVELRELVKRLNREMGLTILISSHILSELHQMATKYGIIHRGRLLEQLTHVELNEKCRQHLRIRVDDPSKAATVLEMELGTPDYEVLQDGTIKLYSLDHDVRRVSMALTSSGLVIEYFAPGGDDLESYFTKRVGGELHD
ncbi:ABC transporter ATP-binding protein [Paenibacillus sp. HGF5]|uniref:ABC transporter ATP-binding protein n=1 Tax=Paenibacillus sp. HGF5 TaxID=908341 RepID=UPI0002072D7B|nr:ABC transporter ATP-binding protein [Paenibacillus sp. HGF5]EGG34680.1 bacitracin ABC transporter, ATP-binding protein BcrA [Paenibacillus sp. HGF5]